MKWNLISEAQPDDRQKVLTFWKERGMIQLQMYISVPHPELPKSDFWFLGGEQQFLVSDGHVTHWAALPTPPRDI